MPDEQNTGVALVESDVLTALLRDEPLAELLKQLCLALQERIPGARVSMLRIAQTADHQLKPIGPDLPQDYLNALEKLPAQEDSGSCGTAAKRRQSVFVVDTQTDPLWDELRDLVRQYGIVSYWSQPVFDVSGVPAGTLAVSHAERKSPNSSDCDAIVRLATFVGLLLSVARLRNTLEQNETNLQQIFDSLPFPIGVRNASGHRVLTNLADFRIHGLSHKQTEQLPIHELYPPGSPMPDWLLETDKQVLYNHQVRQDWNIYVKSLDGSERYFDITRIPFTDRRHIGPLVLSIAIDVTRYSQTEQAMLLSERRFRDFTEVAADFFWEMNAELRFSFFSESAKKTLPVPVESLLGKTRQEIYANEMNTSQLQAHSEVLHNRLPFQNFEAVLRNTEGEIRYFHVSGKPVYNDVGDFAGYRGTTRDVTKERKAEQELKESEVRFRKLAETSFQGIFIHRDARLLFVNKALARILGYENWRELLALIDPFKFVHPSDASKLREHSLRRLHGEAAPGTYEFTAVGKNGDSIRLHAACSVVEWGGEPAILANVMDITEQHQARLALARSEQRFRDFAESAAELFWEQDRNLRFTWVSGNSEKHTGVPNHSILGSRLEDLAATEDLKSQKWSRYLAAVEAREPYSNFEYENSYSGSSPRVLQISGKPIFDEDSRFIGYRGCATEVTEQRRLAERIAHDASHDALTGLVNRREFERRLEIMVNEISTSPAEHAVCFLDLDRFKIVNDTAGHLAGDAMLKGLTEVMQAHVRAHDVLARLGGDEFGLLLMHCPITKAAQLTDQLIAVVSEFRLHWKNQVFDVGMSAGVAQVVADQEPGELLSYADLACYSAKDKGRNCTHIYSQDDTGMIKHRTESGLVAELSGDLDERLTLYGQAIYSLADCNVPVGFEVLLRYCDPDGNLSDPESVIAAAEKYNLMARVDRWVINKAFQWYNESGFVQHGPSLSINLSANSLSDNTLVAFLKDKLTAYEIEPQKICIELTETAAMRDLSTTSRQVNEMRALGLRIAIDDFGSGWSSLAYLKHLSIDYLKIDGIFVTDMVTDNIDHALVAAMLSLGTELDLKVVAEWVESQEVLQALQLLNVHMGQGFGLHRPEALDRLVLPDPGLPAGEGSE